MDLAEYCRPVAFAVSLETPQDDFDSCGTVVHAKSALEACRLVMQGRTELEFEAPARGWFDDDEQVEDWWLHEDPKEHGLSAERDVRWDRVRYTHVNAFRMGWWMRCSGCWRRVIDDDDEDDDGNPLVPHVDEKRDEVYCSRRCAGLEDEESNE